MACVAKVPSDLLKNRPEPLEIHRYRQRLQRIPLGRYRAEVLLKVPKVSLSRHSNLQFCHTFGITPSRKTQGVFRGLQFVHFARVGLDKFPRTILADFPISALVFAFHPRADGSREDYAPAGGTFGLCAAGYRLKDT